MPLEISQHFINLTTPENGKKNKYSQFADNKGKNMQIGGDYMSGFWKNYNNKKKKKRKLFQKSIISNNIY